MSRVIYAALSCNKVYVFNTLEELMRLRVYHTNMLLLCQGTIDLVPIDNGSFTLREDSQVTENYNPCNYRYLSGYPLGGNHG